MIIGGTSGLGLSAARACIQAGARVVVVGRQEGKVQAAVDVLGSDAVGIAADAASPLAAERAIQVAEEVWGKLSSLYHVAGGSGRRFGDGPLHRLTDEGWDRTLELNLRSVAFSNRAAVRSFLARGRPGSILNMTSVLALAPSPRHFATHAYAAAKAAIVGLTRSAAAYYAPYDIRFNALALGLTETPMAERALGDETIVRFVAMRQRLDGGRAGRPEDADAAAVYFLSSSSRFVTGQVLAVDGGWTVRDGEADAAPRASPDSGRIDTGTIFRSSASRGDLS